MTPAESSMPPGDDERADDADPPRSHHRRQSAISAKAIETNAPLLCSRSITPDPGLQKLFLSIPAIHRNGDPTHDHERLLRAWPANGLRRCAIPRPVPR